MKALGALPFITLTGSWTQNESHTPSSAAIENLLQVQEMISWRKRGDHRKLVGSYKYSLKIQTEMFIVERLDPFLW